MTSRGVCIDVVADGLLLGVFGQEVFHEEPACSIGVLQVLFVRVVQLDCVLEHLLGPAEVKLGKDVVGLAWRARVVREWRRAGARYGQ